MNDKNKQLYRVLITHASTVNNDYNAPWMDQKPLSKKNANKFILGAIIDYQIEADMAWDNAKRLTESILGDPDNLWDYIVQTYTKNEWALKWRAFKVHRFPAAHNRIWRIGNEIVNRYDGDARRIWQGKKPNTILSNLENMKFGPEISRMVIGVLLTYGEVQGKGDVKADSHVRTVLGRIFNRDLSTEEAHRIAQTIHPDNPWEIDVTLYDIGKRFCLSDWCYCESCPLGKEDICDDYRLYKVTESSNRLI